ncbi:hypothetical protein ABVV53_14735 [Novosphingobium sp. RD2P27]|uniref:Uncharacterized protein n=1 Tax=Novosphingobium kalidii TaxID=3230299 RepID=A0ABV2D497_9SPHN
MSSLADALIGRMDESDLKPGALAAQFMTGRLAVLVRCPDLRARLWSPLLERLAEQLPWEAPLLDIARNHHGCGNITSDLGDVFYFQPGLHGYIGRKIELEREEHGGVRAHPAHFVQGPKRYSSCPSSLAECWALGRSLFRAIAPAGNETTLKRIALQRLKYQNLASDFDALSDLTTHSLARWGRLGARIDRARVNARGGLKRKGPSDLYGLLDQVPGVSRAGHLLNSLFRRHDAAARTGQGERVVEAAHYDHRYFTALCGYRPEMATQVFADEQWYDLPVGLEHLVVFPGELAARDFGLKPVLHRVLHRQDLEASRSLKGERTRNVTLLLGAV